MALKIVIQNKSHAHYDIKDYVSLLIHGGETMKNF